MDGIGPNILEHVHRRTRSKETGRRDIPWVMVVRKL